MILSRRTVRSASVGLASTSMMYCSSSVLAEFVSELVSSSSLSATGLVDNNPWRTVSPNCGVEVTTTRCCTLFPTVASLAGNTITPVMMAGRSRVSTTKERVRTRSRYSRLIISQVLRMGFAHRLHENLFQRRFHQFELVDARACGCQFQKFLRIGARRQSRFHVVSIIVERLHQPGFLEKSGIAFVLDLDVATAVAGLDLVQVAFEDGAPVIDQADGLAQPFCLVHAMRR